MRAVAAFVALTAACTFHSPHPGGDDVGPGEMLEMIAEPDFTGDVTDGLVAARGALEPDAFARGGLHATAYTGDEIMDNSTYDQVIVQLVTPIGASYRQMPLSWDPDRPHGVGLTTNNNFTLAYDGEILLNGGDHTLAVSADDRAIVQIAFDGSHFSPDMFTHNATTSFPIHVGASGWFPIRMVYGQDGGPDKFTLAVDGVALTPAQLRTRIGKAQGLVAYGFGNEALSLLKGETAVPNVDANYAMAPPPFDLTGMPATRWGVRFAGQLLVDTAGDYTFTVDTGPDNTDGFRLWVDGAVVAAHWLAVTDIPTSAPITLSPGWHDLLVDYAQHDMAAQVHLKMAAASGAATIVPSDHLRPSVAFGHTTGFADQTTPGIPIADANPNPVMTVVLLPAPAVSGAVIDFVDVSYALFNARSTDLTELLNTGAANEPVTSGVTSGLALENYFPSFPGHAGQPLPVAPWQLLLTDSVQGGPPPMAGSNGPIVVSPGVSFLYHGGPDAPFATSYSYTSVAKPTPDAIRLANVHITSDLRGATLIASVRTADNEDDLATATWVDVADGDIPETDASAFLQYSLVVTGDGWKFPSISGIAIDYVIPEASQ